MKFLNYAINKIAHNFQVNFLEIWLNYIFHLLNYYFLVSQQDLNTFPI